MSRPSLVKSTPRSSFWTEEIDRPLNRELAELGAASVDRGLIDAIRNQVGISAVTYTSATPTAAENLAQLGKLCATVAVAYGGPPDVLFIHPRRAAFIRSKLGYAPEWPARVVEVPALPVNLGAGTDQDIAIALRSDEVVAHMGNPSISAYAQVLSGNLAVRFQWRQYGAFSTARKPLAIGVLSGTGMVSPTW